MILRCLPYVDLKHLFKSKFNRFSCFDTLFGIAIISSYALLTKRSAFIYRITMDDGRYEGLALRKGDVEHIVKSTRRKEAVEPVDILAKVEDSSAVEVCKDLPVDCKEIRQFFRNMHVVWGHFVRKCWKHRYNNYYHDEERAPILVLSAMRPRDKQSMLTHFP